MTTAPAAASALERFTAAVDAFDRRLRAIDDRALEAFWAWEAYDEEGVRFGILRTAEEIGDAAIELAAHRSAAGAGGSRTRAQRILGRYLVAWRELWSVADRADDVVDVEPQEGEWPLRTILDHLIEAELGFLATIRNGLEQRRAGVAEPKRIASDEAWLALAEVEEDPWHAALAGPLVEIRVFHRTVRDRIIERLGGTPDDELDWTSPFWDGQHTNRFRLGRFESHLRQHTIQVEKAVQATKGAPREVERLLRLVARATGDVEAAAIGADPEVVGGVVAPLTEPLVARADELAAAVATIHD
ncbi:MAG TPA: DinB family protein [Candidatus Limnocylindrales bacterium]